MLAAVAERGTETAESGVRLRSAFVLFVVLVRYPLTPVCDCCVSRDNVAVALVILHLHSLIMWVNSSLSSTLSCQIMNKLVNEHTHYKCPVKAFQNWFGRQINVHKPKLTRTPWDTVEISKAWYNIFCQPCTFHDRKHWWPIVKALFVWLCPKETSLHLFICLQLWLNDKCILTHTLPNLTKYWK